MQLDTFERVKDKISSPSAPFSLARQRLQRANSGLSGRPAADSNRAESSTSGTQAEASAVSPMKSPFQTAPRPAATTPERARAHKMLVASPVVDLTPPKQPSAATAVTSRLPPLRQPSAKLPAASSQPVALNNTAGSGSKQQSGVQQGTGQAGESASGGPVTPERLPSGRMHSGRIPSGLAANDGEPGRNLKPIQTARNLSRGGPLNSFDLACLLVSMQDKRRLQYMETSHARTFP